MSMKMKAPEELRILLEEFAYQALKETPSDIYQFAADYFSQLNAKRILTKQSLLVSPVVTTVEKEPFKPAKNFPTDTDEFVTSVSYLVNESFPEGEVGPEESQKSHHDRDEVVNNDDDIDNVDDDEDDIMDMKTLPRFTAKSGRRESVAAESFDPEKINDCDVIVHDKTDEQRERLSAAVKPIFIFRCLEDSQMQRIVDAMFEKIVTPNETVIKQGDDGDNFYVIEKGVFDIYVNDELAGNYDNAGSFGELALMYNTPRAATIVAKTEGILWAMDRDTFRKIVLKSAFNKRRMYEDLLRNVDILQSLNDYERTNLADALFSRNFEADATIITEAEAGDEMYFVEEGEVSITATAPDGSRKELQRVTKGGYFGELALLTKGARRASAFAITKVRLAALDRCSFERLMGPCTDVMMRQFERYKTQLVAILGEDVLKDREEFSIIMDSTLPPSEITDQLFIE